MARREALEKSSVLGRKLRRAREGGLGFLGGEAFGPHHRLAVVGLQLQPPARGSLRLPAFGREPAPPALSAIAIALPRCAIASWKAERRSAWSPALPHHSIARSSSPASVK